MTTRPKNIIDIIKDKNGEKTIRLNFIPAYLGYFIVVLVCVLIFFLAIAFIARHSTKSDRNNLIPIIFTLTGVALLYFFTKYFLRQKKILFKGQLSDNEFEIYSKSSGIYSYTDKTVYKQGNIVFHWRDVKEVTAFIAGGLYTDTDCIRVKSENHDDFIITDSEEGYLLFYKNVYQRLKEENGAFYKPQDSKNYIYFFHWERTKESS